jgi:hypothetical protein
MISKSTHLTVAGLVAAALGMGTAAQAEPTALGHNAESTVAGVPVACTGVGQSRHDPRWAAYPVRVDFATPQGHLLADVILSLSKADGTPMLEVTCVGSQVLFKLPAGTYRVEGRLKKSPQVKPQTATVTPPASGQRVTTLRFPDA